MAENATHNLHNLLTLRGALVRDPHGWAGYLTEAIDAFADHGTASRTIDEGVAHAEEVWRLLAEVGVDMDDVADKLEREGVASFQKSFDDLLAALAAKAAELR